MLHEINPYDNFDMTNYEVDIQGWNSDTPVFTELISELKPKLIIEVGTWKGASAIQMASICRDFGLDTKVVCVDTWLGALEFWTDKKDKDRYLSLKLKNGYPQVYYQFLGNVIYTNHQDRIIPFPQVSEIAARWFKQNNVKPDLIYIDASHDFNDVQRDLHAYNYLNKDAVIFGDDYNTWEGVRGGVDSAWRMFYQGMGYKLETRYNNWIIRK